MHKKNYMSAKLSVYGEDKIVDYEHLGPQLWKMLFWSEKLTYSCDFVTVK